MSLQQMYATRRDSFLVELKKVSQRFNLIANLRLGVALLILVLLYLALTFNFLFFLVFPAVIGFIFLVIYHSKLFKKRQHLQNLVSINDGELLALKGDSSAFENGSSFISANHPYAVDLDVFGDYSLFQTINRAGTVEGKKLLAKILSSPCFEIEILKQRQHWIKELSGKIDFRQNFLATEKSLNESDYDYAELTAWIKQPLFFTRVSLYKVLLVVLPCITWITLGAAIFNVLPYGYFVLSAIFNLGVVGFHLKRTNAFHANISRKKNLLQKYGELLSLISVETFYHSDLKKKVESATLQVKQLKAFSSLVYAFDARLNSLMSLAVNALLLYDLQLVFRLEKWRADNGHAVKYWFEGIAEFDELNSFATFYYNNSQYQFPVFTQSLSISGSEIGHPLISSEICVTNSFAISQQQNVVIVTGANMAGKSTFLRAMGLNTVLALSGAPVYAAKFECPIIHIRSGMRTTDSLHDHQSYFYNELNRLKTFMNELAQGVPILLLLDEILKGTNSNDKLAGSVALLKQLVQAHSLNIIATHDIALGDLEKQFPGHIRNFSFEAQIANDQLRFDYKLKQGVAQTMNATFLMRQMGIIPN